MNALHYIAFALMLIVAAITIQPAPWAAALAVIAGILTIVPTFKRKTDR
ncbi:hypothetical protein MUN76_15420 [Leucobacter rhizosphaerae]|uniref:Uncharacterized protein n=1 Tax=Leucobacter rhizosphaerae TaxID=2932245 RepID=A0ABY4FVV9_9MICO|nr:hypothetical protein [Leucobacter rhizosphaerae]UOQ60398.1 hypothetical protein MUN76_15420 [Leucobacter rhizosphaerae]